MNCIDCGKKLDYKPPPYRCEECSNRFDKQMEELFILKENIKKGLLRIGG